MSMLFVCLRGYLYIAAWWLFVMSTCIIFFFLNVLDSWKWSTFQHPQHVIKLAFWKWMSNKVLSCLLFLWPLFNSLLTAFFFRGHSSMHSSTSVLNSKNVEVWLPGTYWNRNASICNILRYNKKTYFHLYDSSEKTVLWFFTLHKGWTNILQTIQIDLLQYTV